MTTTPLRKSRGQTGGGRFLARFRAESGVVLGAAEPAGSHLSVDQLIELAESDDVAVREEVAANSKSTWDIHMYLARDTEDSVRLALLTNEKLDPSLVDQLARDFVPAVRAAAAEHPGLHVLELYTLTTDSEDRVREAAIRGMAARNMSWLDRQTLHDLKIQDIS